VSTLKVDTISPKTSWTTDEIAGNTVSPAGAVLQVVQNIVGNTTFSGVQSDVATTYLVTITPSSTSSKILVSFTGAAQNNDGCVAWKVKRSIGGGSYTSTATATYTGGTSRGGYHNTGSLACQVLDSPNTTSVIIYKLYVTANNVGGGPVIYFGRDSYGTYVTDTHCTAMEIAG
jgi:hypothetical protein